MSRTYKEVLKMGKTDNPILLMDRGRNVLFFFFTKISISKVVSTQENLI